MTPAAAPSTPAPCRRARCPPAAAPETGSDSRDAALVIGLEGRELAVEFGHRGRDEGLSAQEAGIVDQKAGGEIVRAVGDDVVAADQVEGIVGRRAAVGAVRRSHAGIEGARTASAAESVLSRPISAVRCAIWRCRLESAHPVEIDDAERADARRRQIKDHRAAQPAGADHQHAGGPELRLAGPPTSRSTIWRA